MSFLGKESYMDIPREYYHNRTAHHLLVSDETNGILSCGFLVKSMAKHCEVDLSFKNYGAFLLLDGSGEYTDELGNHFYLRPGACVQRLPGIKHTITIDGSDDWLEFFVCFGESTYRTLLELGLLSDTPVLSPGLSRDLLQKCISLLKYFESAQNTDLLPLYFLIQNFATDIYFLHKRRDLNEYNQQHMELAARYLCDMSNMLTVTEVARVVGVPYETFRKKFKTYYGLSPAAFQMRFRINHAKKCLLETHKKIGEIGEICGFADSFCFSKAFKKQCGISPQEFRKLYAFTESRVIS